MPVDPEDFKEHSDRIGDGFDDEIARRCIISRSYYYTFHRMREEWEDNQISRFGGHGGDHGEVSDLLERLDYNDLADLYDDLRHKRNEADYDINDNLGEFDLMIFKSDLQEFMSEAEEEGLL